MWLNPNHPNPPKQAAAPEDKGEPLGTFPRGDGRDELRVRLMSFEGKPYVSLCLWSRNQRGEWWPVAGKSVTVRMREVGGLVEALRGIESMASREAIDSRPVSKYHDDNLKPAPADDTPQYVERGRPVRPPFDPESLRGAKPSQGFNEFEG